MSPRTFASALRVAVLAGGDSAEREISQASGRNVAAALKRAGHAVVVIDPAESDLADVAWQRFDACFIALHGGAGEDGRMQQQLEQLNVPYTGSGPLASRLAMSKSASKRCFLQGGVPTPRYAVFESDEPIKRIASRLAMLGYPLVVKPDGQGSSLGVNCANEPADLAECLRQSQMFDTLGLAEPRIVGREFTVAVLQRRALPLLEIVGLDGIFSFDCKYQNRSIEHRFDPALPSGAAQRLQEIAVAAAESLQTAGFVRVDLMLDRAGDPWVLEVNTSPGMTERSLAPEAAARAGLDLPALCDQLIRECLTLETTS